MCLDFNIASIENYSATTATANELVINRLHLSLASLATHSQATPDVGAMIGEAHSSVGGTVDEMMEDMYSGFTRWIL